MSGLHLERLQEAARLCPDAYQDPTVRKGHLPTGWTSPHRSVFIKHLKALNKDGFALRWQSIQCRTEESELDPFSLLSTQWNSGGSKAKSSIMWFFHSKNSRLYNYAHHYNKADMSADKSTHLPFTASPPFPFYRQRSVSLDDRWGQFLCSQRKQAHSKLQTRDEFVQSTKEMRGKRKLAWRESHWADAVFNEGKV